MEDRTPRRLSIEISEEQYQRLEKLIPYGQKTHLFRTIIDDITDLLEGEDARLVIGAFRANRVNYIITNERRDETKRH